MCPVRLHHSNQQLQFCPMEGDSVGRCLQPLTTCACRIPIMAIPIGITATNMCVVDAADSSIRQPSFSMPAAAGLLFFTTYTLLVLFWAEIYHQVSHGPQGTNNTCINPAQHYLHMSGSF